MEAQTSTPQKSRVFISYSHKDEDWKNRLVEHLQVASREGQFEIWDDRRIQAGDEWYAAIDQAIDGASIAVLLISADFLNSEFIHQEEVPCLLQEREKRGMRLFPVIVRDCLWNKVAWLAQLQVRPTDGKPLANRRGTLERELTDIAQEVWSIVEEQVSRLVTTYLSIFRKRLEHEFSRWDLRFLGVAQAGAPCVRSRQP